jgi:hypothetical protein
MADETVVLPSPTHTQNEYIDSYAGENEILLILNGIGIYTPWDSTYHNKLIPSLNMQLPLLDAGYESWSAPYPQASLNDNNFDPQNGIFKCVIHKDVAYIGVVYKNISDTYIYDIKDRSGRWMSGAEDLDIFYKEEIELLYNSNLIRELNPSAADYNYRNYDIVTISYVHPYALLRRTLYPGLDSIKCKYFMMNLETGEETYICESFTAENIISHFEEPFEWIDTNSLRISVHTEPPSSAFYKVYLIVFDGQNWLVNEMD